MYRNADDRSRLATSTALVLTLTLISTVTAAPQSSSPAATEPAATTTTTTTTTTGADDVVYDQRQNGTENVRINLSDLKVVLAPADGLFEIMSMAGAQLFNSELLGNSASEHRPTAVECTGFKCNNRHRQAAKKNRFKLSSLIAPLLKNQAEQKPAETETSNGNSNNNSNNN